MIKWSMRRSCWRSFGPQCLKTGRVSDFVVQIIEKSVESSCDSKPDLKWRKLYFVARLKDKDKILDVISDIKCDCN